jgi:hypothetical protein
MGFKLVKIDAGSTAEVIQTNDATIEAVVSNFVAYNTSGSDETFTLYSDEVEIMSETVPANGSYRLTDKFNIPATTELTITTDANTTATVSIYVGAVDTAGVLTVAQALAQQASDDADRAESALGDNSNPVITGSITEEVAVCDLALEPDNGTIQTYTATGDVTFTDGLSDGQFLTLILTNGGNAITYPTITWWGGEAPTLGTTDKLFFEKIGSTLYGSHVGSIA